MGVLNFPGSLSCQGGAEFDIISLEADIDLQHEINDQALQNINLSLHSTEENSRSPKRKKLRSNGGRKSYDFREYGVDARRRGAKHQRRKQNLADLMDIGRDEKMDVDESEWFSDVHLTLFTELFLDDNKMKAWDRFMQMSEEKQRDYLERKTGSRKIPQDEVKKEETPSDEQGLIKPSKEGSFQLIDKKIQDMLRTKKLAALGLLEFYEDDVRSCSLENFPSVVLFNLESSYDRLLVYAICQYMKLPSNTIRLKDNSAIIEIDMPQNDWLPPDTKLTDYLKRMRTNS